jgi:hypothetical protein
MMGCIWQTLLKEKYVNSFVLSYVYWQPADSHFWAGIITMKKLLYSYGSITTRMAKKLGFGGYVAGKCYTR